MAQTLPNQAITHKFMPKVSIFTTQDGSHSLQAEEYGVSYHSKYGAIQESRHVFLEMGLHYLLPMQQPLSILEIGFGTGLNALLTWQATAQRTIPTYYEAIDAYPLLLSQVSTLNYPQQLGDSPALQHTWAELHQSPWNETIALSPYFSLHKRLADLSSAQWPQRFNLIYFDAFAPTTQPELWEPTIMASMYAALEPKGILVTYCAKGSVKRALKAAGFQVEALPGPPGKREMTRAFKV